MLALGLKSEDTTASRWLNGPRDWRGSKKVVINSTLGMGVWSPFGRLMEFVNVT